MSDCLACNLIDGTLDPLGGRIHATAHWVVEHCIGSLGVGTLIVKPLRHCTHVWDLTGAEAEELGPLLQKATAAQRALLAPDQVYVCLWSHAGWQPGHIHFVLQPVWKDAPRPCQRPGPFLQAALFEAGEPLPLDEVEAFAARAREMMDGEVDHERTPGGQAGTARF